VKSGNLFLKNFQLLKNQLILWLTIHYSELFLPITKCERTFLVDNLAVFTKKASGMLATSFCCSSKSRNSSMSCLMVPSF
jgi:hypothetical protein